MKIIKDQLEYLAFFLSSSMISIGFFRYSYLKDYQFPYFGLLITSTPMAITGFVILMFSIIRYTGKSKVLYFSGWQYLIIGFLFMVNQLCSIQSLYFKDMDLARFIILSLATEIIFMPLFSFLLLKRQFFPQYIISIILVIIGVLLNELLGNIFFLIFNKYIPLVITNQSKVKYGNFKISTKEGWEGPVLCVIGKIIYVLSTVISKRFILVRAYTYKVKDFNIYKDQERNQKVKKSTFYQDYFEGQEKPKLLKRDSFLNKRFQLFKKFEEILEEMESETYYKKKQKQKEAIYEQFDKDNITKKQLNELQKMEEKHEKFEQLVKKMTQESYINIQDLALPPEVLEKNKNNQKQKFFNLDYGVLNQEELDEVMDMDEQFINTLIRKQTKLKFQELKQWELDAMMKLEEEERKFLLLFLLDYKDIKLNTHFFHDKDELTLTKLDNIYDNIVYDSDLFHNTIKYNLEIYGICYIFVWLGALFGTYFNKEWYQNLYEYLEKPGDDYKKQTYFQNLTFLLFLAPSLFSIFKPLLISRLTQRHLANEYFFIKTITDFIVLMVASTFTEIDSSIKTISLLAYAIVLFGNYMIFLGSQHNKRWAEFKSLIELSKSFFSQVLDPLQLTNLEIRLIQIHHTLGKEEFLRILIDLFASCNPRQLLHTSNPVNQTRQQLDPHFTQRAKNWGDSYPRPSIESIEQTWISTDQNDIWISGLSQMKGDYSKAFNKQNNQDQSNKASNDTNMTKFVQELKNEKHEIVDKMGQHQKKSLKLE